MVMFGIGKWFGGTNLSLHRITQLEQRMDRAGQKWSDLANDVQAMPDRLREEFISRRECELLLLRRSDEER